MISKTRVWILTAYGGLALALTSCVRVQPIVQPRVVKLSDPQIAEAIENQFHTDPWLAPARTHVEVHQGIVRLEGEVSDLLARERAARLASTFKDVRSVINELKITPSEEDDRTVRTDVLDALRHDPATRGAPIGVQVTAGWATLSGTADSWARRELVIQAVKSVRGVRGITNAVQILGGSAFRPDNELRAEIERRLDYDVWLEPGYVDVHVDHGAVTLSGVVSTFPALIEAQADAWVYGVKSVHVDGLRVQSGPQTGLRTQRLHPDLSDSAIKGIIEEAFQYDPRLMQGESAIQVSVADSVVTLEGHVQSLAAGRAAEADAERTRGVMAVWNHLRVQLPHSISDHILAQDVRAALARDAQLHARPISVSVRDGVVMLDGTVDSPIERQRAEEIATLSEGVLQIVNRLRIRPVWEPQQDRRFETEIRARLVADGLGGEIAVRVDHGVATLHGTVLTWAQRRAAEEIAYDTGVRGVLDELIVHD